MKNNIIIAIASIAMMLCASCEKSLVAPEKEVGYLSFSEFSLGVDESVDTRANVGRNYSIKIYDANEDVVVDTTYGAITDSGKNISLTAGEYTLVASSYGEDVPIAEFEQPVYGVSHPFTIEAGVTTKVGELTCTLLQCKVTVAYSDDFIKNVTGAGKTTVTVTAGHSLDYALKYEDNKCTYDQSAGYFAVSGSNPTMTVVFSGSYDGKSAKMTKTFTGIAAKQWRQIKFIPIINEQGDATFDIKINDLISDGELDEEVEVSEEILGEDPDAPKGDGGITLVPDYEAGCDTEIIDLQNIKIVPFSERTMNIKFKATVPGGVKKFTVDIESTSNTFTAAVAAAEATQLDLINPKAKHDLIFEVVPFPHGAELLNQEEIAFDLSNAQEPILNYKGSHTFTMTIVDNDGCRNTITVVMVVE